KGGFRLSLRGYDPEFDHRTITRESLGRRVEYADPSKSLLLTKPTAALPHKGGLRLDPESFDYRILADWIKDGAIAPTSNDPLLERINVSPGLSTLRIADTTGLLVTAHYNDGSTRDVTHWAKFTSTDESIASVDESGQVVVQDSGEGAILVWFGSKVDLARITVPYPNDIDLKAFVDAPRRNLIDELNLEQLQKLNLPPSPRCDDATFLRRATIDTIGRLPTAEQREQYFARAETERRDWLIENLLASEDFVDYWTYKWCDLLLINGTKLRPIAVKAYYQWVREAVEKKLPWDQLVREVLTATGSSNENGATNFYALHQSPEEMTENASQAFLGLSIGCAKCHNHPLEKWTNDQYYGMANLFSRVRAKGWGGDGRNGDGIRTVFVATSGELIQPNRGKPQPPAPLDSDPISFDDTSDRREVLADWMTSPDNPYFARSITNRIWKNFFGRGLVEQVDDLRLSNPATNEQLLDATSHYLSEEKFHLPQLMRLILQSETYQRTSIALPGNASENKYHSRYYPRRMMAEVLLDSIDQSLSTTTAFNEIAFPGADTQKTEYYAEGTRAIQLYDAAVKSYFLKTFGRNPREITCECERSDDPSMVQVLHLSNGDTLNPKLANETNMIASMMKENVSNQQVIEKLFLRALTREPSQSEMEKLESIVTEYGDDRATALQDVAWSILTSSEFTFNH
ncbi:DUF1549 and DUF1553 domain-containing protein, partial [Rhodopirellula sp.]|nr:DUF1549 and DUF1553 domain-containing protein [Rhodopirellula sp.]